MKQEDKQLLLVDLCARLPYGVICTDNCHGDSRVFYMDVEDESVYYTDFDEYGLIENCKPYLRPMSSMTEEEFESLKEYSGLKYEQLDLASYQNGTYKCLDFYLSEVPSYVVVLVFDWLNVHHFDYRGLVEMGLAIAVTEENNPYKE